MSSSYRNDYHYECLISEILKILLNCYVHNITVTDEQQVITGYAMLFIIIKLQNKVSLQCNTQEEYIKEVLKEVMT